MTPPTMESNMASKNNDVKILSNVKKCSQDTEIQEK